MFAKTIIDSDAFLDMPLSTQALYFHLSMRADDDGFINNPQKIQRMVAATEDDLKLLVAKNFIIPFESGVVVIKHWKIHNYIQKDRYKETVYKDEKAILQVKSNNAYTLDTKCIHDVYKSETQDRLEIGKSKDSIEIELGKDREGKVRINYQMIVDMYNDTCVSFPRLTTLSDARKKAIKARMNSYSIDDFQQLFTKAEASNFLKGANNRNWSANFDWLIKDSNMAKVLDGNYDNRTSNKSTSARPNSKADELDSFYAMASAWAESEET
jgi:hypothetical protein